MKYNAKTIRGRLQEYVFRKQTDEDFISYHDQYSDYHLQVAYPRFKVGDRVMLTVGDANNAVKPVLDEGVVDRVASFRMYEKSDKEGEYPISVFYKYTVKTINNGMIDIGDHQIKGLIERKEND